jgi:hypothetical protein
LYTRHGAPTQLAPEFVASLARLLGFSVPEDLQEAVAEALAAQLDGIHVLDQLQLGGLDGVTPAGTFDPHWEH